MSAVRKEPLKLYVWEGVLRDYTPGMVCVLARSKKEAIRLGVKAALVRPEAYLGAVSVRAELEKNEPQVVRSPKGFAVWGGG